MVAQAAVGGRDWKRSTLDARRTRVADAAVQPVSEKYEDIVARLAKVVERLEGGGLSLEEWIAAFEEGIRLARAGAARLEEAERKVGGLLEGDRGGARAGGGEEMGRGGGARRGRERGRSGSS